MMVERTLRSGRKLCRYLYDTWVVDDVLYVKVEAIEFERASEDSFQLAGRRRSQRWLLENGYASTALNGSLEVWDRSRDIASDLTTTITYRARMPLPAREAL